MPSIRVLSEEWQQARTSAARLPNTPARPDQHAPAPARSADGLLRPTAGAGFSSTGKAGWTSVSLSHSWYCARAKPWAPTGAERQLLPGCPRRPAASALLEERPALLCTRIQPRMGPDPAPIVPFRPAASRGHPPPLWWYELDSMPGGETDGLHRDCHSSDYDRACLHCGLADRTQAPARGGATAGLRACRHLWPVRRSNLGSDLGQRHAWLCEDLGSRGLILSSSRYGGERPHLQGGGPPRIRHRPAIRA